MSTTAATEVDADIWFAVAGAKVKIPSINSFVYYFPEGHIENTSGNSQSSDFAIGRPFIPCQVLSIQFLCSNESDQVFAKICLKPVYGDNNHNTNVVENRNDDVVSSVKIVTHYDVNEGTFTMPKVCADSIMPPHDSAAHVSEQYLTIKDTLNNAWTFRHIALGMPRRHLLTTGWIDFLEAKGLTAGDSVVFMRKNSTNELFVGIRRAAIGIDVAGVAEAIESAGKGEEFEVDYYPRFESPEFVVVTEKVEAAVRVDWSAGMMVKVGVEKNDLSGVSWFEGMVVDVLCPESGSPWRMLEVNCGGLRKTYKVNPWEVKNDNDDETVSAVGSSHMERPPQLL